MILLLLAFAIALGQFQGAQFELNDRQLHKALSGLGFYHGDVEADWNADSMLAFRAYAQNLGYTAPAFRHEAKESFFEQDLGRWLVENDVSEIRTRTVGVFIVVFDQGTCKSSSMSDECVMFRNFHKLRVEQSEQIFFSYTENFSWYMAMMTRGIHRFTVAADALYVVSLPDEFMKVDKRPLQDAVSAKLGFNAEERFDRVVYMLPDAQSGVKVYGGAARGVSVFLRREGRIASSRLQTLLHEIGHTLGLDHNGRIRDGGFQSYAGWSSPMGGQDAGLVGFNAPALDHLRVINHNILAITKSGTVKIKSLTSLSEGYRAGDPYSPIEGFVAAVYHSQDDGPEYYIEWRERKRQDAHMSSKLDNVLIVTHFRSMFLTEEDTLIPVGETWTSPRGDFKIFNSGLIGTFEVQIGAVSNPNARVEFFNRDKIVAPRLGP